VRGQGLSGRRGDVDYIGQPDDDLADLIAVVRRSYPDAKLVLVGHSAGGGFVLRTAGEPRGRDFSRFVLLSPYLGRAAKLGRPDANWTQPDVPRIVLLAALNEIGFKRFNDWPVIHFKVPPGAEALGVTSEWSYRMAMSYGPRDDLRLAPPPAYRQDAARAAAPIVLIAGARDEQFFADRYAKAFAGLESKVAVEIAPNPDHMGVVSDPDAIAMTVQAVTAASAR
jgi:pimeloyl-ACP methyl ester carboxylesterase